MSYIHSLTIFGLISTILGQGVPQSPIPGPPPPPPGAPTVALPFVPPPPGVYPPPPPPFVS